MSLADWQKSSWLAEHISSKEKIAALLAIVDRDLANAEAGGLSADWRLAIAYNASKIRMAVAGRGKRGGARVIYYWVTRRVQIHLLLAYSKTERDDLTEAQLRALRDLVRQEFK